MQSSTLIQISPEELTNLIVEKIALILQKQEPKAQTPTDETELLTVQETAAFSSLSVPTIYGLIHKGDLPNLKQGKRCYLLKKDLLVFTISFLP